LVIDDELDICIMLKIVLEQNEFIVNYYYKPVLALDKFKSEFYDLIILDIQMPDINGFQFFREIKKGMSKQKYVFSQQVNLYSIGHTSFLQCILLLENL
jgi:DNA-binding response OmpR family regulator